MNTMGDASVRRERTMRLALELVRGGSIALLGALLCAIFAAARAASLRLTAAVAAGELAAGGGAHPIGAPALVGVAIGLGAGGVLVAIGLVDLLRAVLAYAASRRRGFAAPIPRPARRSGGSAMTHLLRGIDASAGRLPASATRLLATALPWILVVAATLLTEPRNMFAAPFLAFLGALLGRALYAARPATPWARPIVVAGIPLLLALPLLIVAIRPGDWTIPVAFLLGAEIGAHLGELRERAVGRSVRHLAREYAGVEFVGPAEGIVFDVRPLLHRQTAQERREFARREPELARTHDVVRVRLLGAVAAAFPIGILALVFGMVQEAVEGEANRVPQLLGMSAMFALMLLGGGILVWWSTRTRARLTRPADHDAFRRFAAANRFEYLPRPVSSADGTDVLTRRLLTTHASPRVLLANRETAGDGPGDGRTHFGGVCELQISTRLPNISLRSRSHRLPVFSSYAAPARDQIVSLEGDFDRYFEMSVPRGYEADALYLFTPDVMAWLIDDVHGFDVELVDDRVVLRSRRDLVTRDPADWDRVARAMSAIDARITQWSRWRDHRVVPGPGALLRMDARGAVSSGGRRLRRGVGAGAIFAAVFVAVYLTLTVLANVF